MCLCVWVCSLCLCVSADVQMSATAQMHAQMSAQISAQILRSVHRCSDQWKCSDEGVWVCLCRCVCVCVLCEWCVFSTIIIIICSIIIAIAKENLIRRGTSKCKMANYGFRGQEPFDPKSGQRPRSRDGCLSDIFPPPARTGTQTARHSDNQTCRHSYSQTMPGQWC